jgi:chromosome segregation ATPase
LKNNNTDNINNNNNEINNLNKTITSLKNDLIKTDEIISTKNQETNKLEISLKERSSQISVLMESIEMIQKEVSSTEDDTSKLLIDTSRYNNKNLLQHTVNITAELVSTQRQHYSLEKRLSEMLSNLQLCQSNNIILNKKINNTETEYNELFNK